MPANSKLILTFIQQQMVTLFSGGDGLCVDYCFIDSPEGQERLNRAFDRLFNELTRRS